jgi:hypothetical protein
MTLNIDINEDFRIVSDSHNVIIQRRHIVDPRKSPKFVEGETDPTIRLEYRDWKYAQSIAQCADILLQQKIRESDAVTLRELLVEIASFKREISELIGVRSICPRI